MPNAAPRCWVPTRSEIPSCRRGEHSWDVASVQAEGALPRGGFGLSLVATGEAPVLAGRSWSSAGEAPGLAVSAFGDQRHGHVLEHLQVALDAVTASCAAGSAAALPGPFSGGTRGRNERRARLPPPSHHRLSSVHPASSSCVRAARTSLVHERQAPETGSNELSLPVFGNSAATSRATTSSHASSTVRTKVVT